MQIIFLLAVIVGAFPEYNVFPLKAYTTPSECITVKRKYEENFPPLSFDCVIVKQKAH
jgi:hypothetical protein